MSVSLGHSFRQADLLQRALTHPSARTATGPDGDNQQLEFLGDAVLQAALSDLLMEHFPKAPEGDLTAMRASLATATPSLNSARNSASPPSSRSAPMPRATKSTNPPAPSPMPGKPSSAPFFSMPATTPPASG